MSSEADSEAKVELPAWPRAIERADGANFQRQAAGVDADAAADAADSSSLPAARRHQAAIGEDERVERNHAVIDLALEHAPHREPHFEVADQQAVADQLIAAHARGIGMAIAEILVMAAHEITRTEITRHQPRIA